METLLSIISLVWFFSLADCQVLTPPYFNLAEGRRITASSTCGVGVDEPELYCKLVGANSDKPSHFNVIQGQLCEYCDPNDPQRYHPPEHAIDGSERWWQSPPLSRGMDYNAVNLTIDLGQLFQVAYVIIKMGNSPRPGVWVLERSIDNGQTYLPWQYFADNNGDCERFFGKESLNPIRKDSDVICTTHVSKVVPLEGGEIVFSLLHGRPNAQNFFNSTELQEFTRATNVRMKLIRTKTLLGHLMSVARQDTTVTRRYFYSIKDISIGGRCVCNGHASVCDIPDLQDRYRLKCRCEHNTCGSQCESCCPGFIQKKWTPASYTKLFVCEPCNCFGHSNDCIFDEQVNAEHRSIDIYGKNEGGGVCQGCQHNTRGINCNECKDRFYRPYDRKLNDTDVCYPCQCYGAANTGNCAEGSGLCDCKPAFLPPYCDACNDGYYGYPDCKPCDCHRNGTIDSICEVGGGMCPCKENYSGQNCDMCAEGYFGFPDCLPCDCNSDGSFDDVCDAESGQCRCHTNYGGLKCERCEHGFYDYEYQNCTFCNCDARGTTTEICNKETGECLCSTGYSSGRCDTSAPGFYAYPLVLECGCHEIGSSSSVCDPSGKCGCLLGYGGRTCDQCSPGYYNFPNCQTCNCDQAGSIGISCDSDGKCPCKMNFDGERCDRCKDMFYNFPLCEECNCNPAGVLETFAGCGNAPVGELCECKERVTGRICDKCRSLYWNLQQYHKGGCEDCDCNVQGTIGNLATCDTQSGQCTCKPQVTSRKCDTCNDGTFSLMEDSLFGCTDCQCNIGGSVNNVCDKQTGQCQCRHRIEGQRCDRPMKAHYFPTLYHMQEEFEDGRTPHNTAVRYGYDEGVFPGFSWKGYAVYSELQKETLHDIYIHKPSLYRMVIMYHNPGRESFQGKITITPENPSDDMQEFDVTFKPSASPKLMTVALHSGFPIPMVMNPGMWTVSMQNTESVFLDYFVILPVSYYEASLLTQKVVNPCNFGTSAELCLQYAYPDISDFDSVYGSAGYLLTGGYRENVDLYHDDQVLTELNSPAMAWLGANQPEINLDLHLGETGLYRLVINYFTPNGSRATNVQVVARSKGGEETARAILYDCGYSFVCRQVVSNLWGEVATFNFDSSIVNLVLKIEGDAQDQTIASVVAIPMDDWAVGYIQPQEVCVRNHAGVCLEALHKYPPESTKVEFESNHEGKIADELPPGVTNSTQLVYLSMNDSMVEVHGKLRSSGRYVFVVHYFQPMNPAQRVTILIQNGHFYEAYMDVSHCPSHSGCRGIIKQMDGSPLFDMLENFYISVKESGKWGIWLDYVLAVPEEHFLQEDILQGLPRDHTMEFFKRCGENNFFIHARETGFCRDAAFALTSEYNNGALMCRCNVQGSISLECETFGGQCPCRPNVIGRACDACKTGYFGFPNCRPCDCPSTALCGPIYGECICPPRVVGDRCERCAANTYGFDPIIGCEECHCSSIGVQNGKLQCDLQTGNCDCKDNVIGRTCNKCTAGYWSFPFCQLCNCDLRGTEVDICNQHDATCFCKENTEGRSCDICVRGSFHLEESNPDGCTKCFCFGKSQICSSSNLYWKQISFNGEWLPAYIDFSDGSAVDTELTDEPAIYSDIVLLNLKKFDEPLLNGYIYLSAKEDFLGNVIMSYGGTLNFKIYTLFNDYGESEDVEILGDVVIRGNGLTAIYFLDSPPMSGETNVEIRLIERNFRTLTGVPLRRDQFMTILHKLDGLFIRAQFGPESQETRLSDVRLSITTSDYKYSNFPALPIEQCQCPRNYQGSSCEECADGYFRAQAGPYGGFCTPCQCNNHADTCDKVSGKCINCRDHTTGDHCDQCIGGYFGDATKGTPYDCLICSCPLPSITNNFALSCEINPSINDIHCECKPGYSGSRCGVCAPGYYGEPQTIGEFCKPCECNGNIDASSPYSCDDISGLCLLCLNHSHGTHCDRCEPGYFGDAIQAKDCTGCTCDECGTRNCHHYTGNCECHDHVVGDRCDRCERDYWGFASCQGCHACNCDVASESSQCDLETGQCSCKQGVIGQRCDRCRPGYWDYTDNGCKECSCRGGFSIGVGCDPQSGQCSCLPGVIGPNCDGCPHRWALIEGYGCEKCDDCVHALLDSTDELANQIYPVIAEYASAAQSFFLHQRLELINGTVFELSPKVDILNINDDDLNPVRSALDDMQNEALAVSAKADLFLARAISSSSDGLTVLTQAQEVLGRISSGMDLARTVVDEINKLVIGLETGEGAKIEQAINEAEYIVLLMRGMNFTLPNDVVTADLENALDYLNLMKNLTFSVMSNKDYLEASVGRLRNLNDKIDEMKEYIDQAQMQTTDVHEMSRKSKIYGLANVEKKYSEIGYINDITMDQIKDAQNYTTIAGHNLDKGQFNFVILGDLMNELKSANEQMNNSVTDTKLNLDDIQFTAQESVEHARNLKDRADRLDSMLVETRHVTENALAAANAYDNIVMAIDDAYNAAKEASFASDKAVNMSMGTAENAQISVGSSEEKYTMAESKITQVEDVLLPRLNQAQMDVRMLKHMDELQSQQLDGIKIKLDGIPRQSLGDTARNLQQQATQAEAEATEVYDAVNGRYESLQEYAKEARDLSKNLEGAKRDTKLAFEQIKNVEDILPGMQETASDLLQRKDVIQDRLHDVGDRLERLRRTIKSARERTNKIKVGIDFESGSVVELKNPDDLIDTATATELSVYIRTTEPDGLPLFLGTPVGGSSQLHRTSTDDFMALELEGGYMKLTTNLGAGPHPVRSEVYVADGRWHKILVKRIGKVVRLSVVSEEKETGIQEFTSQSVLPGTYSILNLDPKVSKLYVGGIPPGVEVEQSLLSTNYIGQMEELWINGKPVGLWNFVSKGPNTLKGAKERIILKGSASDSLGLRFSGTGFSSMETQGREISPLSLILSFKTFAEDGLLYLLENKMNQYVSLELRGGRVLYQHNFGSGALQLLSEKVYNDNQWHVIEATRVERDAIMQIDQYDSKQGRSQGDRFDFIEIPEIMYFGGFAGDHVIPGVTNMKYRGCIKDVSISKVSVDFLRSIESIGTVPGCQEEVVSLVSFERENPGYVFLQSPHDLSLQLVFKFKTSHQNGLLFYTETQDKTIYLSLSMAEGALVLRSSPGGEITTGAYTQYNDSSWHIVIATRENNELRLDIDDFEVYSIQLIQESVPFDGPAFFGGLPEVYSVDPAASAVDTNFIGCLGDATLNGKIINFAASSERPNALMDVCMLPKDVTVITYLPESPLPLPQVPSGKVDPVPSPGTDRTVQKTPLPFFTYGPSDQTDAPVYITTTQPLDRCALPVTPLKDLDVRPENGARFGNKRDTRIEYEELPDNLRGDFVFSLDFRTQANEGIIFYASSINHRDYVTIYMNDGKIMFSFSAGTSPATMRSMQKYNDETWHKLVAHRTAGYGRLEIDGYIVANGSIGGSAKHIEHMAPYYYGGLDTNIIENAQDNTERTDLSFNGCLRGFRMNNKIVGGKRSIIGVSECSYKVEQGIFFGEGQKSHVVVRRRFNVGMTFELSLELKPRKNNGVIMSVHGRRDFIMLQLRDGTVEAKVDNGRGIVTSQFNSSNAFSICDGNWHKIHVVKNKHVIILVVDGVNASPGTGPLGASSCETHSPFFLGSQPRIGRRRGNAVKDKYSGCMRNVNLNLGEVDLAYALFVGNVNAGVCPLH